MGNLKERDRTRNFKHLESAVDIFDKIEGALRKERSPAPTPARVKIGLTLIRFGIALFRKII